jgi:seryl-tRNA synthetase
MINLKDLIARPERYKEELTRRFKDSSIVDSIIEQYNIWKNKSEELDTFRAKKNDFNDKIITLNSEEKLAAIVSMKEVSDRINELSDETSKLREELDSNITKIPNLTYDDIPIGRDDSNNIEIINKKITKDYTFVPVPYYEMSVYKKYVDQEVGVNNFGSRGYYIHGKLARFQKVLFDWAEDIILAHGLEYFYVPLLLNTDTLSGTGHYPDFDGQMYEVPISEDKSTYLIGSSEPSMISYYRNKHLETLTQPLTMMANTTCFRKEAGSYGKDQQGILRVHQFEKIEMNAICRPEDNNRIFKTFGVINEEIFNTIGLSWRSVEVCSGDIPSKHYRQVDYEAYFPGTNNFREVSSNGSASDYQNRTLNITYTNAEGKKDIAWGLNCTGITFRTGLAIMEQFQNADGSFNVPSVLQERMGCAIID